MERLSGSAAQLAGLAGALLGWRPEEFWKSTPAELDAVLHALTPAPPGGPSRAEVERLMEMFPDG